MDRAPDRKLNIGCGDDVIDGWANLDRDDHGQEFIADVLGPIGIPWGDGWFDLVYANHFLQSFGWDDLERVTAEIARVMRPGARILILVPHIVQAFHAYDSGNTQWSGFRAISEPWDLDRKFAHYLTWGGQNRTCFTWATLCELLDRHDLDPRPVTLQHDRASMLECWPPLRRFLESLMIEGVRR